jgi:hypothetical protein
MAMKAVFADTISDVWIAMKYVEIISEKELRDEKAEMETYWKDKSLLRLAQAIWTALKLPTRGDVSAIAFAAR